MVTRLTALACIVAVTVLAAVASARPVAQAQRSAFAKQEGHPVHFAAFPPVGVKPSTPTTGRMLLSLRIGNTWWTMYADGRIIWQKWTASGDATVVPAGASRLDTGWVQQRLTLRGVQLLRSKILSTGLFEHNLRLDVGKDHAWLSLQARRGDRIVRVDGVPSPDPSWKEHFTKPTPAQTRALGSIEQILAYPARWLPASAWADRRIRAFVPARYWISFDRGYPDSSKLPAPTRKLLSRYLHGCTVLTIAQARALLQSFAKAGVTPSDNHALYIGFDAAALGSPHPTYLHLHPALPDDHC